LARHAGTEAAASLRVVDKIPPCIDLYLDDQVLVGEIEAAIEGHARFYAIWKRYGALLVRVVLLYERKADLLPMAL